jgi:uncharacterized protein (TIGR00299 family) protein
VTVAWFHCFAGIAGDMAMASLIDAGADVDEVRRLLERLPVTGWWLETSAVLRAGVGATHVQVKVEETGMVRTFAHICGVIEEGRLPDRIRDRSLATFTALAEVEAGIHRRPTSQVHFHEVGGVDAIIDIVGTCSALEVLGVDRVAASAVATGSGMVRSSHGLLPNPAPAVVELLRGVPTYGRDVNVELTTPTGAALLAANASDYGPLPPMVIEATGYGAGERDIDGVPNVTQVVLGRALEDGRQPGQPVTLLEVNVDDATGETLAHTVGRLMEVGAHDAWVTPIVMKKGRPGHTVSALTDPALTASVSRVLVAETGSLGVRAQSLERWPAARSIEEVDVDGLPLRVKVSEGRVKVEHEDAARAARRTGRPLREVVRRAEEAWHGRAPSAPPDPDEAG